MPICEAVEERSGAEADVRDARYECGGGGTRMRGGGGAARRVFVAVDDKDEVG